MHFAYAKSAIQLYRHIFINFQDMAIKLTIDIIYYVYNMLLKFK